MVSYCNFSVFFVSRRHILKPMSVLRPFQIGRLYPMLQNMSGPVRSLIRPPMLSTGPLNTSRGQNPTQKDISVRSYLKDFFPFLSTVSESASQCWIVSSSFPYESLLMFTAVWPSTLHLLPILWQIAKSTVPKHTAREISVLTAQFLWHLAPVATNRHIKAVISRLIFYRQIYKAQAEALQELKKDSSDFFSFLCF